MNHTHHYIAMLFCITYFGDEADTVVVVFSFFSFFFFSFLNSVQLTILLIIVIDIYMNYCESLLLLMITTTCMDLYTQTSHVQC